MTRFNNKYPYTDFHELNADWLLETVKDAAAEAQEASDTVATYNDRLTTVEGDLAPIKAAMPGLASDVSDLQHDVGLMDSLITNTINPGLETLQTEVETASTGLLDRMTAAEGKIDEHDGDINNIEGRMVTYDQNFININNQFISDQGRISALETYRTEAQVKIGNLGYSFAPLFDEDAGYNAGDYVMSSTLKLHRARVNIMPGTADIHDLTQFQPTDVNNALHEGALPLVTSADAGDVLTVDGNGDWVAAAPGGGGTPINITAASNITIISNKSKRVGDTVIIDFSFSTDAIINANDYIVTTQFLAPGNAAPNYFVTQSNVPVSQRMLLNVNGYLTTAESITQGVTIVVNYRYEV